MKCRMLQQWEAKALGATHVDLDSDYLKSQDSIWYYLHCVGNNQYVWSTLIGDELYFEYEVRSLYATVK